MLRWPFRASPSIAVAAVAVAAALCLITWVIERIAVWVLR